MIITKLFSNLKTNKKTVAFTHKLKEEMDKLQKQEQTGIYFLEGPDGKRLAGIIIEVAPDELSWMTLRVVKAKLAPVVITVVPFGQGEVAAKAFQNAIADMKNPLRVWSYRDELILNAIRENLKRGMRL